MTTGSNFWDYPVWSFIITLTSLFLVMMSANIIHKRSRFLRRSMIPSSVLGGFILLIINTLCRKIFGKPLIQTQVLEMLTYHGLGLGFVAMSLRTIERKKDQTSRTGGLDTGLTVVSTYLLQAILGLILTIVLYYSIGSFPASGLLLPMGYGQGPGQAFNWGKTYEMSYGFTGGTSFGLTVAAMGFVSASVGGVIALNILRRKGILQTSTADVSDVHAETAEKHVHKESTSEQDMEKFTVQMSLVFIAYIAAYLFMLGVNAIVDTGVLGNFGYNTVRPLIWGFNFMFGTLFALLLKAVLRFFTKKNIIHRDYTSNFMQSRISDFMFNIMVVASIAAIDLSAFTNPQFILPLSVICILGAIVTYIFLRFLCPRVFPAYPNEAFLSLYGMLTGTASTGIILLRELDPKFESQAATNLVAHLAWAMLFGFPMLLLLSVAPQGMRQTWITLGILTALFAAMLLLTFRRQIFRKKR